MMEPDDEGNAGIPPSPADAALDAELRRWAEDVVPLPSPPYSFERVLVRAHRRKVRRRMTAATASLVGAALVFGGLVAGGVLPGVSLGRSTCPSAAAPLDPAKGSSVNRKTEYAIGGVLAAGALTAGVVAGCTGNSGSSPSASSTGQASPSFGASTDQLTLPSVSASVGAPTSASAPGATPSATTNPAVPQCGVADLTDTATVVSGSQATGHEQLNIVLTNASGHTCTIYGFPGLKLEDKNQDSQASHAVWSPQTPPKTLVTLTNGQSAASTVQFDYDMPVGTEPTSGPCEPASYYIQITPPNNTTQLVAQIIGTNGAGVTVCSSGTLDASAFVPGSTGPNQ
ncbi:MAG TPA: DUF4232 domain-containing protein [Actinocrinis sp.]|nr:DUF4232 domain-containing protein [Actinocrinis sp.]